MRKQICIRSDTGYSLKVYRFASAPFSYKINKVSLLLQILVFKAYIDLQTPLPKSLKNLRCYSRLDCHEDCDFSTLSFISRKLCTYILLIPLILGMAWKNCQWSLCVPRWVGYIEENRKSTKEKDLFLKFNKFTVMQDI